jgi:hypothetical protein
VTKQEVLVSANQLAERPVRALQCVANQLGIGYLSDLQTSYRVHKYDDEQRLQVTSMARRLRSMLTDS